MTLTDETADNWPPVTPATATTNPASGTAGERTAALIRARLRTQMTAELTPVQLRAWVRQRPQLAAWLGVGVVTVYPLPDVL